VKQSKKGTHFLARCPLCGDSKKNPYKKRFNMDYNNGVPGWNCFNCDEHGNFYEIYSRILGISYEDAVDRLKNPAWGRGDKDKTEQIKQRLEKKKEVEEKTEYTHYNWIVADCEEPPERYENALRFFYESRKIPWSNKLYICYQGKYKNRIVIPVFDEDQNIVYFQARRIPGTNIVPKYDNPASPKEIIILNNSFFNPERHIVVTEGIIDAWMVGDQGTTCLGKYISPEFLAKLFLKTTKGVIVALDNDDEGRKALAKFMKENKFAQKVKYFFHPPEYQSHDDINSIVRSHSIADVYRMITQNSVNFSTAYAKLTISNKLLEGKKNADNKSRIRLHKRKRTELWERTISKYL
jgi:DNA primase